MVICHHLPPTSMSQPHVASMHKSSSVLHPCRRVYSVGEVAEAVLGMMDKTGVKEACFVAHSYGELYLQAYVRRAPRVPRVLESLSVVLPQLAP